MLLQDQFGHWTTIGTQDPSLLLIRAPSHLQSITTELGGVNPFGLPYFRIVWQPTRYDIFGYVEVDILDDVTGERVGSIDESVMQLKYVMPEGMDDCWIVERWHPVEDYVTWGRGDREVVWPMHGLPNPVRQFSPLPIRGDYEAIELSPAYPAPLFNDYRKLITPDGRFLGYNEPICRATIKGIIDLWRRSRDMRLYDRAVSFAKRQELEDRRQVAYYCDYLQDREGPWPITPHSGYGVKGPDLYVTR